MILPQRQPDDGAINVHRDDRGEGVPAEIIVTVSTGVRQETIRMSEYNAARVLCALCLFLGVPMPKALGKMKM